MVVMKRLLPTALRAAGPQKRALQRPPAPCVSSSFARRMPFHAPHFLAVRMSSTGPDPGNRFTKALQEFAWLKDQRKECEALKEQLDQMSRSDKTDKKKEETIRELNSALEQLQQTIDTQETYREKLREEFEKDRELMERWFRQAGLEAQSAKFAMDHFVKKGFESATLPDIVEKDIADWPRLTPQEKSSVVARAAELSRRSQGKRDEQKQREWEETRRSLRNRLILILTFAAILGLVQLFTSQKFKAVLAMVKDYKSSRLPALYHPRDDVEEPIQSAINHVDPNQAKYLVVSGPTGCGKSTSVQYACRRKKGIVVGQVRPTHSVQEVYAALASGLGLHLEPGVDYQGLVMDALWWVTKLTRHVPTVVLDMCDVEAESAPAVHEVAKQLASRSAVFICATPTSYARDLMRDKMATVHSVRDFQAQEAAEVLGPRDTDVPVLQETVGLRPSYVAGVSQQPKFEPAATDRIVEEARQELQQLVEKDPRHKSAIRLLGSRPYSEGVPAGEYAASARHSAATSPLPYTRGLCYDATGKSVLFMSQAHHTAAQKHFRGGWLW